MVSCMGEIGMRICLVLAALAAFTIPAAAADLPIEQVTVSAEKSLRGIWKIGIPGAVETRHNADVSGGVGGFSDDIAVLTDHSLLFAPPREQICRIGGEETLVVRCISFGKPDDGAVAFRGDKLTLAWNGNSSLRLVVRGSLQSEDRFTASFLVEQERETHSAPNPIAGDKVNLAATNDDAGLGVMLRGALAGLSLGDASLLAPGAPDVMTPKDLAGLGRVQATYYVGQAPLLRDPQARPALDVYAVEFVNGERLCGIHLAHGKVDGLRCV